MQHGMVIFKGNVHNTGVIIGNAYNYNGAQGFGQTTRK